VTARDLVLVIAWVVFGIGGGGCVGWAIFHRYWPAVILAAIAMCFGIACGIAAWS
jgi:hypothetical protein